MLTFKAIDVIVNINKKIEVAFDISRYFDAAVTNEKYQKGKMPKKALCCGALSGCRS